MEETTPGLPEEIPPHGPFNATQGYYGVLVSYRRGKVPLVKSWNLSTVSGPIDDLFSAWVAEKLPAAEIEAAMELAVSVFEDKQIAEEWLRKPNLATDNKPPISLLGTDDGFLRVQTLLHRIDHGILA